MVAIWIVVALAAFTVVGWVVTGLVMARNIIWPPRLPRPEGPNVWEERVAAEELRKRLLDRTAYDIGFTGPPDTVYAVLLDWGMGAEVATVVACANGDASLLLTNGSAIHGTLKDDAVCDAARNAVIAARGVTMPLDDDDTLPLSERVRLTFLTGEGRRSTVVELRDLVDGDHDLSFVFYTMNEVITELQNLPET